MVPEAIQAEVRIKAEFYDVDSLRVVWHGNYVKYLELARSSLLDKIGYNYHEMEENGVAWPIVTIQIKYVKPMVLGQEVIARATLLEYEHRIKMAYVLSDAAAGTVLCKAETVQMGVEAATGKSLFVSPSRLTEAVRQCLHGKGKTR